MSYWHFIPEKIPDGLAWNKPGTSRRQIDELRLKTGYSS